LSLKPLKGYKLLVPRLRESSPRDNSFNPLPFTGAHLDTLSLAYCMNSEDAKAGREKGRLDGANERGPKFASSASRLPPFAVNPLPRGEGRGQ
jgi:hypothetical protein